MCNVCTEDHPNHLYRQLKEAHKLLLQQQPVVLTNPFPHWKNRTQGSLSVDGSSQGTPASFSNPSAAKYYMMKGESYIVTREHDYRIPEYVKKGKEATNLIVHLQIEKPLGKTMTRIPKGVFKEASHNPYMRATQNYFVVDY
jgi:hypothetical protein